MSFKLSISAEVTAQVLSAVSFYEGLREGLGEELETEVSKLLERVCETPLLYPREFGPIHKALVKRFNQVLFYVIEKDTVVVVEFRDARQKPPNWRSRGFTSN